MTMRELQDLPAADLPVVQEAHAVVRRELQLLEQVRHKAKHVQQVVQAASRTRDESRVILKQVSKFQAEVEAVFALDQPLHPGGSVRGAVAARLAGRWPRV